MTRGLLIGALALAVGCILVLNPLNAGAGRFSLTAEFPEVPDSCTLYRVVPATLTAGEVANRLGLSGEVSERSGEFYLIDTTKDPEERLTVYADSGAVAYHIPDRELPAEMTRQPDLPADAEAEAIALAFLEKTGMASSDARVVEIAVNQRHEVWSSGGGEPEVSYDVTLAVRFGRSLDGLPVYGDEFAVILGAGGDVVGLVKTWREVEPAGDFALRPPEEAYADLLASRTIGPAAYDRVTIESITLGYWMEPRGVVQDTVRPVYAFTGTAVRDGALEPYVGYVSAARDGT
ncbi:calcium-dependent protein kinase [Methanoculleus sp.]|uniref:calcium-dependent protein kinase n=1 Tax=Methanoculleus sp. TaxID=90427 RepID=UPI0025FFFCB0|nr:calcium-dependent protein kinase [Methanoculleus sp.]